MEGGVSFLIGRQHRRPLQLVYISTTCASLSFGLLSCLLTQRTSVYVLPFSFDCSLNWLSSCIWQRLTSTWLLLELEPAIFSNQKAVQNKSFQNPLRWAHCCMENQAKRNYSIQIIVRFGLFLSALWASTSPPIVLSFNSAPYCFLIFPLSPLWNCSKTPFFHSDNLSVLLFNLPLMGKCHPVLIKLPLPFRRFSTNLFGSN